MKYTIRKSDGSSDVVTITPFPQGRRNSGSSIAPGAQFVLAVGLVYLAVLAWKDFVEQKQEKGDK